MQLKIDIVDAADFIKTTPVGQLDIEASTAVLDRLCAVTAELDDYYVVIDLRRASSVMSVVDVWYLAQQLGKCAKTFRKNTAILLRETGNLDQAEFFELSAQNRGYKVQVFTDFEQAIRWLGSVRTIDDDLPPQTAAARKVDPAPPAH